MKKYSLTFLFILAVSAVFAQGTVRGIVYADANGNNRRDSGEKGIAGIAVSNGRDIALTDAGGSYTLPIGNDDIIFVIKPAGYKTNVTQFNVPQFYYIHKPAGSPSALKFGGVAPTGKLPKSVDFALVKYDEPTDFRFFAFGDPQPYGLDQVAFFKKGIVEEANKIPGMLFGLTLGDIVGDNLSLHAPFLEAISGMNLPWYNVIGNHDRDYDSATDAESDDSYERSFGPSSYAFQYGNANFLVLNDIISLKTLDKRYVGGLREDQLKFIENYLKLVPKENALFIAFHIPLAYKPNQFRLNDREQLFELLREHTNSMVLTAHTHIQNIFHYGKEEGWNGPGYFIEYNVGTTNGNWWSGRPDENGVPVSMMTDGTPKGYAVFDVKGTKFTFDYKVAGKPADYVMEITCPKVVADKGNAGMVYVNFFIGSPHDTVEYRIDKGKWKRMKLSDALDPTMVRELQRWDDADELAPGRRPSGVNVPTHLWQVRLDNQVGVGEHTFEVRATDLFGRVHKDTRTFRVEKQKL